MSKASRRSRALDAILGCDYLDGQMTPAARPARTARSASSFGSSGRSRRRSAPPDGHDHGRHAGGRAPVRDAVRPGAPPPAAGRHARAETGGGTRGQHAGDVGCRTPSPALPAYRARRRREPGRALRLGGAARGRSLRAWSSAGAGAAGRCARSRLKASGGAVGVRRAALTLPRRAQMTDRTERKQITL